MSKITHDFLSSLTQDGL